MKFQPEKFKDLAGDLLRRSGEPAVCRTAISRAYYATYLFARSALDPHFVLYRNERGHHQVCGLLSQAAAPEIKRIGEQLSELRG